jgi:hypothetical protein
MENKLPTSLSKKISDEAEEWYSELPEPKDNESHYENFELGFTAAAQAILSNPGAYGLAGAWVNGIPEKIGVYFIRDNRNGYDEKDAEFYDGTPSIKKLFSQKEYWHLSESAPPVDKVGELTKTLETILEWVKDSGKQEVNLDDKPGMALYHIKWLATNALIQLQQ